MAKKKTILEAVEESIEQDYGLERLMSSLSLGDGDVLDMRGEVGKVKADKGKIDGVIDSLFVHCGVVDTFNAIANVLGKLPPCEAINYDAWEWLSNNFNRLVNAMHENNRKVKETSGHYPFGCNEEED